MHKVAHYRNAQHVIAGKPNLITSMNQAFDRLVGDTGNVRFPHGDLECLVFRTVSNGGGHLFHFIQYEADSRAAVISLINSTEAASIDEIPPEEEGQEYIKSQLFLHVDRDHALYVTHNMPLKDGPINGLLLRFCNEGLAEPQKAAFALIKMGNQEALRAIAQSGVGQIDLGLGTVSEALDYLSGENGDSLLDSVFGEDLSDYNARAQSDIKVKLVLTTGRRWQRPNVREYAADISSEAIANFTGDVKVFTKDGSTFTQDEMVVKKTLDIEGNSRAISARDALSKLETAMTELRRDELIGT